MNIRDKPGHITPSLYGWHFVKGDKIHGRNYGPSLETTPIQYRIQKAVTSGRNYDGITPRSFDIEHPNIRLGSLLMATTFGLDLPIHKREELGDEPTKAYMMGFLAMTGSLLAGNHEVQQPYPHDLSLV